MDREILVADQVEESQELVSDLLGSIKLAAVFWAKNNDGGFWSLYLAIPSLDLKALTPTIRLIDASLDRIRSSWIQFSQIQLIDSKDPAAVAVVEILKRHPAGSVIHYTGDRIGDLVVDDAYLLPRLDAPLSREEVVRSVYSLMKRTGDPAPSLLTLRDGGEIEAVPRGIQVDSQGIFQVLVREVVSNADRLIRADDVVGIRKASSIAGLSR